jgi:hypothetical protein
MTIRRGFLYTGVFLLAAGGVILLEQTSAVDTGTVTRALSLWPLAVIAIGVALVVRHTRAGVPGGMLAAAMPGLLLGGLAVSVPDLPDLAAVCGAPGGDGPVTRQGTFGSAASVDLDLACGDLVVTSTGGSGWQLDAAGASGAGAVVTDTADRLAVRSTVHGRSFDGHGDNWQLRLPTGTALDLAAQVSAGKATFNLEGARLTGLRLDVNAAEAVVNLLGATVPRLVVDVNATSAVLQLPATGDLTASLDVNAGSLEVCAPTGLGLRVHGETALGDVTYNGLVRAGDAWESRDYSSATFHADLNVSASVASVVINPEGGCL